MAEVAADVASEVGHGRAEGEDQACDADGATPVGLAQIESKRTSPDAPSTSRIKVLKSLAQLASPAMEGVDQEVRGEGGVNCSPPETRLVEGLPHGLVDGVDGERATSGTRLVEGLAHGLRPSGAARRGAGEEWQSCALAVPASVVRDGSEVPSKLRPRGESEALSEAHGCSAAESQDSPALSEAQRAARARAVREAQGPLRGRELFEELDVDGDGALSMEEIKRGLRRGLLGEATDLQALRARQRSHVERAGPLAHAAACAVCSEVSEVSEVRASGSPGRDTRTLRGAVCAKGEPGVAEKRPGERAEGSPCGVPASTESRHPLEGQSSPHMVPLMACEGVQRHVCAPQREFTFAPQSVESTSTETPGLAGEGRHCAAKMQARAAVLDAAVAVIDGDADVDLSPSGFVQEEALTCHVAHENRQLISAPTGDARLGLCPASSAGSGGLSLSRPALGHSQAFGAQEARRLFAAMDANGDGRLSVPELKAMRHLLAQGAIGGLAATLRAEAAHGELAIDSAVEALSASAPLSSTKPRSRSISPVRASPMCSPSRMSSSDTGEVL